MNEKNYIKKVERINLQEQAFVTCRQTPNVEIFKSNLDLIYRGKLIDINVDDNEIEKENTERKEQIKRLKGEIEENNNQIKYLEQDDIKRYQEKINELKQEITEILSGNTNHSSFNAVKFGINLVILIAVSLYLYLFYASATTEAISVSNIDDICDGNWSMTNNDFSVWGILAPFAFFGFGYALHILFESPKKIKYLWITLLVAMTFLLDGFISKRIYEGVEETKLNTCGSINEIIPFLESDQFYIVLGLGFIVFIISVLPLSLPYLVVTFKPSKIFNFK